jgi:hypothetical protein
MSAPATQPTISDVRLERFRLGELPAVDREEIAAQLAGDPALRRRLSELEQSDREIAKAYPAREMAEAVRRRAGQAAPAAPGPRARPGGWLVPAGVAATVVCVAAVAATIWLGRPAADDATFKGGGDPSLVLHRKVSDGSEELTRGAAVRQGDQIRVGYRASGHPYGAILSIDGRGTLSQHLPRGGDRSAALQPTGTVFLDFAYELDDAPRWEAFYLVTADGPFDLEPVRRAVHAAADGRAGAPAALTLPRGFTQHLFLLNKDSR